LRGLAIASSTRAAQLPDLPTFDESGYRGFESSIAHGILVPAKTPASVVAKLNQDINEAIREPEYRKHLTDAGALVTGGSAQDFREFLATERRKWSAVIQRQRIRAE